MRFKQKSNQHSKFLKSSRQALVELGIPLRTMELDAWVYLLEHGTCFYTNWTIDNLNQEQISRLLELVSGYEGNYSNVLQTQLEYKLK
jgi:hypothetical protein